MLKILKKVPNLKVKLVILGCLLFSSLIFRSTFELIKRGDTTRETQARISELEREQAELLKLKEEVDSPQFAEEEARNKLGLARPDETVVVMPDDDILRKFAPDPDKEEYLEEKPIFRRWIKLFF